MKRFRILVSKRTLSSSRLLVSLGLLSCLLAGYTVPSNAQVPDKRGALHNNVKEETDNTIIVVKTKPLGGTTDLSDFQGHPLEKHQHS